MNRESVLLLLILQYLFVGFFCCFGFYFNFGLMNISIELKNSEIKKKISTSTSSGICFKGRRFCFSSLAEWSLKSARHTASFVR